MAGWVCADCTAVYAVGAPRCPHCRSNDHYEEGAMPKITVHGGPSNRHETAGAVEPPASTAPAPGQEDACPGSSSETSSEKPQPSSEPSVSATPSRARKTASHSKRARTGTSSAPSTDGDPAEGTSAATD